MSICKKSDLLRINPKLRGPGDRPVGERCDPHNPGLVTYRTPLERAIARCFCPITRSPNPSQKFTIAGRSPRTIDNRSPSTAQKLLRTVGQIRHNRTSQRRGAIDTPIDPPTPSHPNRLLPFDHDSSLFGTAASSFPPGHRF